MFKWFWTIFSLGAPELLSHITSCPTSRLFTVLYFSVRSSKSSALRYGLPSCMIVKTIFLAPPPPPPPTQSYKPRRSPPSVHLTIKIPVTVRRSISKRSHEKIGDCEQSILLATLNQIITSIRSLGYYIPESTVRTDRNHLVENVANASHSVHWNWAVESYVRVVGVDKVIVDSIINASHYGKNDAEDKEIMPLLNSCVLPRSN